MTVDTRTPQPQTGAPTIPHPEGHDVTIPPDDDKATLATIVPFERGRKPRGQRPAGEPTPDPRPAIVEQLPIGALFDVSPAPAERVLAPRAMPIRNGLPRTRKAPTAPLQDAKPKRTQKPTLDEV